MRASKAALLGALVGVLPAVAMADARSDLLFRGVQCTPYNVSSTTSPALNYWSDECSGLYHRQRSSAGLPQYPTIIDTATPFHGHIAEGQSWQTLSFPYLGSQFVSDPAYGYTGRFDYDFDHIATLYWSTTPYISGSYAGPETSGAGVSLPGNTAGDIANFNSLSNVTIENAAAIAQSRFQRRGKSLQTPLFIIWDAYPGSGWNYGGDDGVGLKPGGTTWSRLTTQLPYTSSAASLYGMTITWQGVDWVQGGDGTETLAQNETDLGSMESANDGLSLTAKAGGLNYYIGQFVGTAADTTAEVGGIAQYAFVRGSTNGRTFLVGSWYPYPLDGASTGIHMGVYGTMKFGELFGLAHWEVEDNNAGWNPLWRSSAAITRSGTTITVPLAGPNNQEFTHGLSIDTTSIAAAPQLGWHVHQGGVDLAVSSVTVSGWTVSLVVPSIATTATATEVSYAMYGPGDPTNTHVGVWGNIKTQGPPSTIFKGETVDSWLSPFAETPTL